MELASRRVWQKETLPRPEEDLETRATNSWNFQGLERGLFNQLTTEAESDSTKKLSPTKSLFDEDSSIALTTASSSASFESLLPTEQEKIPLNNP